MGFSTRAPSSDRAAYYEYERTVEKHANNRNLTDLLTALGVRPGGVALRTACPWCLNGGEAITSVWNDHTKCHSCKKTSFGIDWVMAIQKVDRHHAIGFLAGRAGIAWPFNDGKGDSAVYAARRAARLMTASIIAFAHEYYRGCLLDKGNPAVEYIAAKGFPDGLKLGYAPDTNAIVSLLKNAGYGLDKAVEAGILRRNKKGNYISLPSSPSCCPAVQEPGDCDLARALPATAR